MSVTIVYVAYRTPAVLLRESIASVTAAAAVANVDTDFIVVNNGGGVDYLAELGGPNLHVVGDGTNLGFGAAVNQALARDTGEMVLLMNPDSTVQDNIFVELEKARSAAGTRETLFGSLLNNGGAPQILAYNLWWSSLGLALSKKRWAEELRRWIEFGQPVAVPRLCGAGLYGAAQTLRRLGPFDDSFFLYGEDVDLSLRAAAEGVELTLVPRAVVLHDAGTSSPDSSELVARAQTDAHFRLIARHRSRVWGLIARLESIASVFVGLVLKPQSPAGRRARSARLTEVRRWGLKKIAPPFHPAQQS
ncbi:glycosyltransferase family 2 protein [Mycetocola zhadangensis]|uniref:glycosyltransferase family 2 protein n=1 Tax=Mycetocola zhadangensis TaxID=1164595 RepID=UPI003A4DDFC0